MSESGERVGRSGNAAAGAAADAAESDADAPSLADRDRRILAFERDWTRHAGAKEDAVRAEFGLSSARYYQILNALIDSPAAIVYDPMLVRRLQRMREARMSARTLRRAPGTSTAGHS
ncbi:MAG TPA: DUF3263 domain-containing protein [Terrimesophilobacter sp.]|nr:DUF3263 domain-containing protein [Terrimesophilobacter sp.]